MKRQLDANAYLKEYQQWEPGGLHCKFLYQQMFLHATATSQSEYNHTIHWGRREPSAESDLRAEPTTMELVSPDSTWEEITEFYQDVYQFQRLSGRSNCKEGTVEGIHQEVLDSNKASGISSHPHCQRQSRD